MDRIELTDGSTATLPGLLPHGTDVEHVLTHGDERELTAVWNTYHDRRAARRVLDDPRTAERARAAFTADLARTAEVTACQALAANRRLVELLTGRRWYVMRDAREDGASWSQIGGALEMSKQAAQQYYRTRIEAQETHVPDFHDAERSRAALSEEDR